MDGFSLTQFTFIFIFLKTSFKDAHIYTMSHNTHYYYFHFLSHCAEPLLSSFTLSNSDYSRSCY